MSTVADQWPKPHRINVDEYYRMAEVGLLRADERVELIEGEVVEMAPIGSSHAGIVNYLSELFFGAVVGRAQVTVGQPLRLGDRSEPQPDVAVLKQRADRYSKGHPTAADVHLLIEISDATLRFDLGRKSALYASHGVPELWIVDLVNQQLHCRREPMGESYQQATILQASQSVAPLALPEAVLPLPALFALPA